MWLSGICNGDLRAARLIHRAGLFGNFFLICLRAGLYWECVVICGKSGVKWFHQPCIRRLYGRLFHSFFKDDRVATIAAQADYPGQVCQG